MCVWAPGTWNRVLTHILYLCYDLLPYCSLQPTANSLQEGGFTVGIPMPVQNHMAGHARPLPAAHVGFIWLSKRRSCWHAKPPVDDPSWLWLTGQSGTTWQASFPGWRRAKENARWAFWASSKVRGLESEGV